MKEGIITDSLTEQSNQIDDINKYGKKKTNKKIKNNNIFCIIILGITLFIFIFVFIFVVIWFLYLLRKKDELILDLRSLLRNKNNEIKIKNYLIESEKELKIYLDQKFMQLGDLITEDNNLSKEAQEKFDEMKKTLELKYDNIKNQINTKNEVSPTINIKNEQTKKTCIIF